MERSSTAPIKEIQGKGRGMCVTLGRAPSFGENPPKSILRRLDRGGRGSKVVLATKNPPCPQH